MTDKEIFLILFHCCTWYSLVWIRWSWFNHFFIDGHLDYLQVSAIVSISVSILSIYPCAKISLSIYSCGAVGGRVCIWTFYTCFQLPYQEVKPVYTPTCGEWGVLFLTSSTTQGFSVFRQFANLMSKKWKHQIAVSLVTREGFSCASCFRSMFMSRNRMYLLAQTSRDLYSRKMKNIL